MLLGIFLCKEIKCQSIYFSSIKDSIVDLGSVANNDQDFSTFSDLKEILKDVELVMLGEQSHGEATAYETKIKLIKYLNQEMGFDLLIFESGFYDCHKAWEMIVAGEDVRDAMGNSIFSLWSTIYELKPLANYIENARTSEHPLKLLGFDNQITGKYSKYLIPDLSEYLKKTNPAILETSEWEHFAESVNLLAKFRYKEFKKRPIQNDTLFVQKLILELNKVDSNSDTDFWIQTLESVNTFAATIALKKDFRDKQMAENLIWLKEKYPKSKIICWGATSHFLYNSDKVQMKSKVIQLLGGNYYKKQAMMGEYLKRKYKEKVFTIGFTAYQGEFGLWRKRKLDEAEEGTFEFLLAQSQFNNFLLPLHGLHFDGYKSRPLGNFYMNNPINEVMDAVIFNRDMRKPKLDRNFFLKIYPENKYIKPEIKSEEEDGGRA